MGVKLGLSHERTIDRGLITRRKMRTPVEKKGKWERKEKKNKRKFRRNRSFYPREKKQAKLFHLDNWDRHVSVSVNAETCSMADRQEFVMYFICK
jgi:hypothetical protein